MKPMRCFSALALAAIAIAIFPVQAGAAESDALVASTQLIVVTTADWSAVDGRLQRYQRATPKQAWRPVGGPISIVVGKTGLAWGIGVMTTDDRVRAASDPIKEEGDGKAPAGVFALGTAFGYQPQPLRDSKMPYLNLTSSVE
jgi:L,D-peptidoglycan transpeptidase YkuD (ErfK/YbiS/YcfS/YnhG family)